MLAPGGWPRVRERERVRIRDRVRIRVRIRIRDRIRDRVRVRVRDRVRAASATATASPLVDPGLGHAPEWNMPRPPQGKLAVAVTGPMDATAARRVLAAELSRLTFCAEGAIQASPVSKRLEARARLVVAKLAVAADGAVKQVLSIAWGSEQAGAPLAPCMEAALRPLRFSASSAEGGVIATITPPPG